MRDTTEAIMTPEWGEIGSGITTLRPLPCLLRSESCSTSSGTAPVDRSADIELLAVVVVAVSILAVLALAIALIALVLNQRGRQPAPAEPHVRRLDNEVPVLPPEAVPVHLGYQSRSAASADRPLPNWG